MTHLVQAQFHPEQRPSCFCGSGQRWSACCGNLDEDRSVPFGINILEKFLDPATCRKWVSYLEQQPRHRLMVVDTEKSTNDMLVKKPDNRRITEEVETRQLTAQISGLVRRAYSTLVRKAFNKRIAWFETPMVLRYNTGGQYQRHADSDYYDPEQDQWFKCMDRDVSLLIYLNEEYSGGTLKFINFNFTHQPRTGDLVFFPSDHRYMHEAQRVESGVRYAITSWAAFRNQLRVMAQPPHNHIKMPVL
jgi:hypothetical protein